MRDGRPIIELSAVSKTFRAPAGTFDALAGASLHVAQGEFICLIGASGCGKSTLLRLIGGFEMPSSGSVRMWGVPVTGPGPERGMVFQDYALFPWLTVRANVAFGPRARGMARGAVRALTERLIDMVGLATFAEAYPYQLSGGMRQRVAIARALVAGPRLLLMDEPFGALDEITRDRLNEELLQVWESTGTTIVFVTHSIYEAAFLGQRVLLLAARPGRVREMVPVTLPTPRKLAMRETQQFVELAGHLRRVLESC